MKLLGLPVSCLAHHVTEPYPLSPNWDHDSWRWLVAAGRSLWIEQERESECFPICGAADVSLDRMTAVGVEGAGGRKEQEGPR
jgi:hypothetical protein